MWTLRDSIHRDGRQLDGDVEIESNALTDCEQLFQFHRRALASLFQRFLIRGDESRDVRA